MSRLTEKGIRMGNPNGKAYANWYNKLANLEDIEDEYGCPLEVVFKAIRNGILFISDKCIPDDLSKKFTSRPRLYYSDDLKCYRFEIGLGAYYVKLKDYKKTWWLKEDMSE